MEGFVNVGPVSRFPKRRGRCVDVEGLKVAVFRLEDRWVALQDACPHMGASLSDGRLDGNHVRCHWHHWRFDLDTGACDMRSWAGARVFEVRVRDHAVFIRRPEPDEPRRADSQAEGEMIPWDPDRFFKG